MKRKLKIRTLQGMILDNFCVGWYPFDSLSVPFGSWSYFCSILYFVRSLFALFGSLLVPKSLKQNLGTLSAKHPEKIPGTLSFAPHVPMGLEWNLAAGKFDKNLDSYLTHLCPASGGGRLIDVRHRRDTAAPYAIGVTPPPLRLDPGVLG